MPPTAGEEAVTDRRRPAERPWATLEIVHGLGEHAGRWEVPERHFEAAGLATSVADLPGHGRAPGRRGHASYAALLDLIEARIAEGARRHPTLPAFIYGHSMGGNLALNLLLRRELPVQGVVASAPALRTAFEPPAWKLAVGRIAARVAPALSFQNELDTTGLATDPAVEAAYRADPLVHDRVSAGLAVAILDSGEWALEHADRLGAPALLMHGDGDPLVAPEGSRTFVARSGGRAELVEWPGLRHEIHNEPVGAAVLDTAVAWMRRQAAAG